MTREYVIDDMNVLINFHMSTALKYFVLSDDDTFKLTKTVIDKYIYIYIYTYLCSFGDIVFMIQVLLYLIVKTPAGHADIGLIDEVLIMLDGIIRMVDTRTGQAKCQLIKDKLRYIDDSRVCFGSLLSVVSGRICHTGFAIVLMFISI